MTTVAIERTADEDDWLLRPTRLWSRAEDQSGAIAALRDRGAGAIVVTLGAAGARLVPRQGEPTLVHAYSVDVVDTTAAGDAFVAAFAVALAEALSPVEALVRGNAAGALTVTQPGAQPSLPTRDEVDAWLRAHP